MIGSDKSLGRKLFLFICFLAHLYIVSYARRSGKCIAGDGSQGVCVVKRYCREAAQQELLPCEGDYENHCCPIPTTHRSAPQPVERPRHEEPKNKRPSRERDDRQSNTPPSERSPSRSINERPNRPPIVDQSDSQNRRPTQNTNAQRIPQNRPRPSNPSYNQDRQDPRRPDTDRFYPAKDDPDTDRFYPAKDDPDTDRFHPAKDEPEHSRTTSPPRWVQNDPRIPRKNKTRTPDDLNNAPIKFPRPSRPTVPACGVKPYELFIAGGEESREHEWPWMTAIFRRYQDSRPKTFLCGGSLINTRYVLTAAHCFVNNYVILPASSFVVRLGSHFLDSGEEYTVSNLIVHHNHSGSEFFNDIALIRLASEVFVTDKIAPICLPSPDMMGKNFVGEWATVAGWGDVAFRSGGSRVLQHVKVPVVTGEECSASYSRVRGAAFLAKGSDHIICAGLITGGKDACLGDSGGPLMIKMSDDRWIIVGIVSLGYKCAEPGYPGVYTRVTHYMSWIGTHMKRY